MNALVFSSPTSKGFVWSRPTSMSSSSCLDSARPSTPGRRYCEESNDVFCNYEIKDYKISKVFSLNTRN